MLKEIIREIEEMDYPRDEICRGLREKEVKDRGGAAAFGFSEAQDKIVKIICNHSNDGWIFCGDGKNLPEEPEDGLRDMDELDEYIVMIQGADIPTTLKYAGNGEWYDPITEDFYSVIAWHPYPDPYLPQKSVGEDYKQQIMERFLKVEQVFGKETWQCMEL